MKDPVLHAEKMSSTAGSLLKSVLSLVASEAGLEKIGGSRC